MWWVMMLSTHRDIKVKEGAAGSDGGHLRVAVELSSLQHVRTKLSNTHFSCSMKGVCCVHVCACACMCACIGVRMSHLWVSLCMCTHCLSYWTELLKWMIGSKAFFQASVLVLVIVTTVLSLLRKAEDYLCLYAKWKLLYSREMLHKFWNRSLSPLEWIQC